MCTQNVQDDGSWKYKISDNNLTHRRLNGTIKRYNAESAVFYRKTGQDKEYERRSERTQPDISDGRQRNRNNHSGRLYS